MVNVFTQSCRYRYSIFFTVFLIFMYIYVYINRIYIYIYIHIYIYTYTEFIIQYSTYPYIIHIYYCSLLHIFYFIIYIDIYLYIWYFTVLWCRDEEDKLKRTFCWNVFKQMWIQWWSPYNICSIYNIYIYIYIYIYKYIKCGSIKYAKT